MDLTGIEPIYGASGTYEKGDYQEQGNPFLDSDGDAWYDNVWNWLKNQGSMIGDAWNNALTGQRDYDRQVALKQMDQEFDSVEQQKGRDYNTMMSNTAIQRAAADYEAAGFNRANAIGGGAGGAGLSAASSSGGSVHDSSRYFPYLMDRALGLANNAVKGVSVFGNQMENILRRSLDDAKFRKGFSVNESGIAGYLSTAKLLSLLLK